MIIELLKLSLERKASDIILSAGNYPAFKVSWEIVYLEEMEKLDPDALKQDILTIVPERYHEKYQSEYELDFSIELKWFSRFRVNAFKQKNGFWVVFRVIPSVVPEFENLWLPKVIQSFSHRKSWLVLITGWVGSGKSTTLASLLNEINKNYKKHIITVEDPIEYVHASQQSLIEQRELWGSTLSFENGLKYALRQASDVIMIWEMRDIETFRLALRAAETGNLVFATLHTSWAARTISRIIDMFPGEEKWYIRAQLAESLLWIVWQDLIKKEDGSRVMATEVLVKNKAIENMIREDHVHQINSAIETGKEHGMIPMIKYLEYLLSKKEITQEIYDAHVKKYWLEMSV